MSRHRAVRGRQAKRRVTGIGTAINNGRDHRDFVQFLASQLEAVVGRYRNEVYHWTKRLSAILMRPY